MNKTIVVSLLIIGLLFIAGCSTSTDSVPRGASPSGAVPVGGGCGVASPADSAPAAPVADARIAL